MKELIFATNNPNKIREVQELLGDRYCIVTPVSIGITDEIPEDYDTLEQNALQKARYIYAKTGLDCFADDTGLEVTALNGEPGVLSARYAGPHKNSADNIRKLLSKLIRINNREARFRTAVALIMNGKEYLFEGIVAGKIIDTLRGTDGFGYDPVFIPDGYDQTFAEMPLELKNRMSHRARAVTKLVDFLKNAE